MDYLEEQRNEVEILKSIFTEELTDITENKEYTLKLTPSSGGATKNFVGVTLHVVYSATYPDELPTLKVKVDKGLSPDQLAEVQALAMKTATENLGMVMIFTIAEAIKDWLIKNNVDPGDGSMFAEMMASMKRAESQGQGKSGAGAPVMEEEEDEDDEHAAATKKALDAEIERERKRVLGTAVTPENFLAWRAKFELELAQLKERTFEDEVAGKPSGRELFELGGAAFLAAAESSEKTPAVVEEEEEDGAAAASIQLADLPIDASIFLAEDPDLEGLDDDDDSEYVEGEEEEDDDDSDDEDYD